MVIVFSLLLPFNFSTYLFMIFHFLFICVFVDEDCLVK